MPSYPILCFSQGCGQPAAYKIAARWSDGVTHELKTYGLTCEACLSAWFRRARERHAACRRAERESLEPPGIYRILRGERDRQLERLIDLEKSLSR